MVFVRGRSIFGVVEKFKKEILVSFFRIKILVEKEFYWDVFFDKFVLGVVNVLVVGSYLGLG